ncbi:MAG: hypothetical protein HZB41_03545 [Ignavibacteriae bacterium]|nr:hypothetical protein [Ignavibacteriota bacterium]
MKSKIDKSLKEVWDMKDRTYKRFKESGYKSYTEYIQSRIIEIELKKQMTQSN